MNTPTAPGPQDWDGTEYKIGDRVRDMAQNRGHGTVVDAVEVGDMLFPFPLVRFDGHERTIPINPRNLTKVSE